ncbi:DUF2851 family protein, partial [Corallococcus sp. AB049A]|uniref:DUF2851 family protein n=1 Tax=Corallococcus sp. AB049A TaxID=2316721 RepID=UPI000EE6C16E
NNIILHVVWQNDKAIPHVPTLCLQERVAKVLLKRYEELMNSQAAIPCNNLLIVLNEFEWIKWKERLAIERMEVKAKKVLSLFEESNHHWEEVFWWMLAYNFGLKVNAEIFIQMAKYISVNVLAKHKQQINQLEAILLGTVNLLNEDFEEVYP